MGETGGRRRCRGGPGAARRWHTPGAPPPPTISWTRLAGRLAAGAVEVDLERHGAGPDPARRLLLP